MSGRADRISALALRPPRRPLSSRCRCRATATPPALWAARRLGPGAAVSVSPCLARLLLAALPLVPPLLKTRPTVLPLCIWLTVLPLCLWLALLPEALWRTVLPLWRWLTPLPLWLTVLPLWLIVLPLVLPLRLTVMSLWLALLPLWRTVLPLWLWLTVLVVGSGCLPHRNLLLHVSIQNTGSLLSDTQG